MLRWLPNAKMAARIPQSDRSACNGKGSKRGEKRFLGFLPHSDFASPSFCISFPLFTSVTVVVAHFVALAMAAISFAASEIQSLHLHNAVGQRMKDACWLVSIQCLF